MSASTRILAAATLGALALTGCSTSAHPASVGSVKDGVTTLKVGASPTPHGDIVRYVESTQAAAAGLHLEVVEFSDYVQPNKALTDKSIDVNFFQHQPYLDDQIRQHGYKISAITPVIVTPLAVYSHKVHQVSEIPANGTVAVPNDPTNEARALQLLAEQGLFSLKSGVTNPTARDIDSNPRHIKVQELEAAQTPRALPDVDAAVVNQNYASPAGLKPAQDAIAVESAQNNPYANVLAARTENKDDPAVKKLASLLCSEQTKSYIAQQFDGQVLASCPAS